MCVYIYHTLYLETPIYPANYTDLLRITLFLSLVTFKSFMLNVYEILHSLLFFYLQLC